MGSERRRVAVIWIDLDHFKEVEDIFGHELGDEMVIESEAQMGPAWESAGGGMTVTYWPK